MAPRRFSLDYASPGIRVRPRRIVSPSADALLCLVKLIGCLTVATAIGSILALGVCLAYEFVARSRCELLSDLMGRR